jgi:hypothetical protein
MTAKRLKRPRDPVQLGKLVGDILTGQVEDRAPTPEEEGKNPASWYVGGRDSEAAMTFMDDLAPRMASRVQLTSDGHKPYLEAIEGAFGGISTMRCW